MPNLSQNVIPIGIGQHQVEHDEVRRRLPPQRQARRAVTRHLRLVSLVFEIALEARRQAFVVLDDQHSPDHAEAPVAARSSTTKRAPRRDPLSIHTLPPCRSTSSFTTESPSPAPPFPPFVCLT